MGKITRLQILYPLMQWKPHSCMLKYERQFWHKVQSMVLKIFICPSHIANWSLGLLESMGHDWHPIRAFGGFPLPEIFAYDQQVSFYLKMSNLKDRFWHNSCMGVYGKYLQVESREIKRWKVETLERLCLIQDYYQTKAWILTSFWPDRARGMNRNKRNGYKLMILVCIEWSMHKERILRRGNWSILCEG